MNKLDEIRDRLATLEPYKNLEHPPDGALPMVMDDVAYLLGVVAGMHGFEERLIESMDRLRYETIILADRVESARGWAKLWKREAKLRRDAVANWSRMWHYEAKLAKDRGTKIKHLREYVVHKHNDCWQTGKCVCGLDDIG